MKGSLCLSLSVLALVVALPADLNTRAQPKGFDISSYQPSVNFAAVKAQGAEFVLIKVCGTSNYPKATLANILEATEGTAYKSPSFSSQYTGATNNGLIRGSYHFALPDKTSGAAQANFFLAHGGGWSSDGRTLPGMLDIEYNPYGSNKCYGLSQVQMVTWIRDFVNAYRSHTNRYPLIYTTTDWWKTCTGDNAGFGQSPLVLARYGSSIGALPAGWKTYTFWQFADQGPFPGDQDVFNGDSAGLKRLALG